MKGGQAEAYAQRFDRVFAYIDKHLADELSVERLSRVVNFSKFHFHRQFSQYVGISVVRYIRLMRLRRASYRLAFEDHSRIIDIAMGAGFENPESFSRAFKHAFGQTPSQFRKRPAWQPWHERYRLPKRERKWIMDVKIVDFPHTRVAALEHRGAPDGVNDTAVQFIAWRKASGLSPVATSGTYGVAYDDPATTPSEAFRFDICGAVPETIPRAW